jgi:hypothetical protein
VGFRDLAVQAIPPPEPPKPAQPVVAVAPLPPAPPPPPEPARVYAASDVNVVPPATVHQELPPFSGSVFRPIMGVIEVVIDESGAVSTATIRGAMNPIYDKQVLSATRDWRYRPAMLNGTPVRYRKFIQIALSPK